jgi:hypothetical protein
MVSAGEETFRVKPGLRGTLSALRNVRGHDLRVNEDDIVRAFENGKGCQVHVRVLGEIPGQEKVSTLRAAGLTTGNADSRSRTQSGGSHERT